jgi:pimeloyl-ACP methyl ester carboxylesterase
MIPETQSVEIHGHRVSYWTAGDGPVIVLLHGITSTMATWKPVLPWLAERYTVVAPDLLGHGESAKPRGDYSLGAHASGVRDLLAVLGHRRATVVGHSLGGGIAMQFAYQFPERTERLVLVSSGGLGPEVHPLLRAATLPGADLFLGIALKSGAHSVVRGIGRGLGRLGLVAGSDLEQMARGYASLEDADARRAFMHTVRSVIDPAGQRVDARDRLYLAAAVPTLIVWGARDPVIPLHHGCNAHQAMPASRFVTFTEAGHFPHLDDPHRFVQELRAFIETTQPADLDVDLQDRLLGARHDGVAA